MKHVPVEIIGPGHIEAIENCTVNLDERKITFTNEDQNAGFALVHDDDGGETSISMGRQTLPKNTNFVMLEAHAEYDTIQIVFTESLSSWAQSVLDGK